MVQECHTYTTQDRIRVRDVKGHKVLRTKKVKNAHTVIKVCLVMVAAMYGITFAITDLY